MGYRQARDGQDMSTDLRRRCDVCRAPYEGGDQSAHGHLTARLPDTPCGALSAYSIDLCGTCAARVVSGLSRERMIDGMFDEEAFDRGAFGREKS